MLALIALNDEEDFIQWVLREFCEQRDLAFDCKGECCCGLL